MANFIDDLGEAIENALQANIASFTGAVDSPQGTAAFVFDYTQEQGGNNIDGDNVCNINFVRAETIADYEGSAQSMFIFQARFKMHDVAGANKAVAVARQGMTATFANRGRTALETYFSNADWLGKSGRIAWTWDVTPVDQLADRDHPIADSTITVVLDHNVPLS